MYRVRRGLELSPVQLPICVLQFKPPRDKVYGLLPYVLPSADFGNVGREKKIGGQATPDLFLPGRAAGNCLGWYPQNSSLLHSVSRFLPFSVHPLPQLVSVETDGYLFMQKQNKLYGALSD